MLFFGSFGLEMRYTYKMFWGIYDTDNQAVYYQNHTGSGSVLSFVDRRHTMRLSHFVWGNPVNWAYKWSAQ